MLHTYNYSTTVFSVSLSPEIRSQTFEYECIYSVCVYLLLEKVQNNMYLHYTYMYIFSLVLLMHSYTNLFKMSFYLHFLF